MADLYTVEIGDFTEKHFVKRFRKKYKQNWDRTEDAILAMYARVDNLIEKKRANVICEKDGVRIIKSDFSIVGSNVSPKTSGNRCVAACLVTDKVVKVLVVYHKSDIEHINNNETLAWKALISDLYPEFRSILSNFSA